MWIRDFINLFFPKLCQVCGTSLLYQEKVICLLCVVKLPRSNFHLFDDNPISRIFWGRVNLNAATSFLFFSKGGSVQKLIHNLKYRSNKETGYYLGELMSKDLLNSPLYYDIDCVIPVPLHKKKLKKRGFNQSEIIADGICSSFNLKTDTTSLIRSENTETQTKKSRYSRWKNVEGSFTVIEPSKLVGKHILLVDDVLTTGATIEACAQKLLEIPNSKVSVVTLAYAQA